jgi:hypothetical protein
VFAAARLGEEGLVGAALAEVLRIGVRTTIGQQAVLEEVPEVIVSVADSGVRERMRACGHVQLPGAVTQLRASLADVKVADLWEDMLALLALRCQYCSAAAFDPQTPIDPSEALPAALRGTMLRSRPGAIASAAHETGKPQSALVCAERERCQHTYLSSHGVELRCIKQAVEEASSSGAGRCSGLKR